MRLLIFQFIILSSFYSPLSYSLWGSMDSVWTIQDQVQGKIVAISAYDNRDKTGQGDYNVLLKKDGEKDLIQLRLCADHDGRYKKDNVMLREKRELLRIAIANRSRVSLSKGGFENCIQKITLHAPANKADSEFQDL